MINYIFFQLASDSTGLVGKDDEAAQTVEAKKRDAPVQDSSTSFSSNIIKRDSSSSFKGNNEALESQSTTTVTAILTNTKKSKFFFQLSMIKYKDFSNSFAEIQLS